MTKRIEIRWAVVCLALIVGALWLSPAALAAGGSCTVTPRSGLNLRAAPGTTASVVMLLPAGDVVTPLARTSDSQWLQVARGNRQGWVAAAFVKCTVAISSLPVGATSAPTSRRAPTFDVLQPDGFVEGLEGELLILTPAVKGPPPVFREALTFRAKIYDPEVERKEGKGITSVTIRIYAADRDGNEAVDANGNILPPVHEQIEQHAGYCAFGGGEPDCNVWVFADHGYKWPNGKPMTSGFYKATISVAANDPNKSAFWFFTFALDLPDATRPAESSLVARIVAPTATRVTANAFAFRVEAYDPAVGTRDGAGIARVEMRILGPDGQEVHQRTESTAGYCVFGGGEPTCNRWDFAAHGGRWPGGALLQGGLHTLQATIHARNGRTASVSTVVEIQP